MYASKQLLCAPGVTVLLFSTVTAHTAEPRIASVPEMNDVRMDDIVRAWKRRHEQIRSGRFSWTETRWIRKGSIFSADDPFNETGAPLPSEDVTLTYDGTFVFDGEFMRYEERGPRWHPRTNELLPHHHIGTWDGTVGNVFRGDEGYPHGEIYDFAWELSQSLFAFRVAFRMLHPQWYSLDVTTFVLTDRVETIDGYPCLVMETSPQVLRNKIARGRRPLKYTYWISPQQDFVVVRYRWGSDGAPPTIYEVSYAEDPEHGWYPTRWTTTEGEPPTRIEEGRVSDFELNIDVDQKEFSFEFPPGSVVRDKTTNEEFIAQADGGRRLIQAEELFRGATYEDLLRTPSGEAGLRQVRPRRGAWLFWGVVILIAFGLLAVVGARYMARGERS